MNYNFKTIEKKITADGWERVRMCGSHFLYRKIGCSQTIVIPNHKGKDLSIAVIKNLENWTGLSLRR